MRLHKTGQLRLLCFDLENRPSAYWYDGETTSEITAFGWKWSDERSVKTMLLTAGGTFVCDDGTRIDREEAYTSFSMILECTGTTSAGTISPC